MEYLYDKQFYIDRYDLSTIKECRDMVDVCTKVYIKGKSDPIAQGPQGKGELAKATNWITNQYLFQIIAQRHRRKKETIETWMQEASLKQDAYDMTEPPKDIKCPDCSTSMNVEMKQLEPSDTPLRMMFLFECPSCKKRRWVYEDGQERPPHPTLCRQCKKEATVSVVKKGQDKLIWKIICQSCEFSESRTDDFAKDRIEREQRETEEKKLLELYREVYCSERAGNEALAYVDALPVAEEVYKEQLKKYDSQAYTHVANLKKLTIIELERVLISFFQKERYINLVLHQPEIGQHVIVGFTIQDDDPTHRSPSSVQDLKKKLNNTLETTNWRVMTEGLSNRLGYVTGRLKGYEREEDFFEIAGEKPEERKPTQYSDMRKKYEYSDLVQLAKLSGEFQGKENARKRRLIHEPDGFLLEDGHTYSCGLCGESHSGHDIWWSEHGLHCNDCHRHIIEKLIPDLGKRDDRDTTYFVEWQLSSDLYFGIHPSTARKMRRQGLLHGHDLTRKNGQVYFTIYLYRENQAFLKQHPQKERNNMIITDLLGEQVAI